jgi:hypothetical protein
MLAFTFARRRFFAWFFFGCSMKSARVKRRAHHSITACFAQVNLAKYWQINLLQN